MIKLDAGNVLLKPSQRRQLMGWLRRPLRLGQKMGDFMLTLTLNRTGSIYDVRASVYDRVGQFDCHLRQRDWRDATRNMARMITTRLHDQYLRRAM